jgi:hypothetical protein
MDPSLIRIVESLNREKIRAPYDAVTADTEDRSGPRPSIDA